MESKFKYELEQIRGATILLVEDILINQLVASKTLTSVGLHASIANNGKEALDKIKEFPHFDLVFMDLQMPVMDGYTASQEIRKNKQWDQIPVIAMSSDLQQEVIQKCFESGMNGFIAKPVDSEAMFEMLVKWVKPRNQHVGSALSLPTIHENDDILPQVKGINVESVLNRINHDKSLLKKLLVSFYDANATFVDDVSNAFNSCELEKASRLVHTIKGVSGNIGANELYEASIDLEQKLKGKVFNHIQEILQPYSLILNPLLEELRLYKQSIQDEKVIVADSVSLEEIDKKELDSMIKTLKQLLTENDMEANNLLIKLKNVNGSAYFRDKLITIEQALKNYDFDEALHAVNDIMNESEIF